MSRVGFAGLGRMGAPMARNIRRAGHELVLWNRTAARAEALAGEIGCGVAESPRALASEADIVVTMLADDPSSVAVHNGPEGLFAGTRAKTFVEMGTMSPAHIAALCYAAPEGAVVIDAPVSGSTPAAEAATLLIMAGCTEEAAETAHPVLDTMGRKTVFLGTPGAGAVMKLAVNSLIHGLNQTLAEAVTLAEAAGIAPEAAFDVIEASAAGAPMIGYRRPLYLDEAAHEVTFTVALARKDMEITAALAEALGTAMPQGRVTLETLGKAEAQGYGARDMAAMLNFMREGKE
ncbi:NAD(P)-dependent oxidoreductase [Ovoidimarina sediminis]|uniref:NAD(P)-dependent oxidoreductase n=1 Tax=Ovoidimarina sediminis TaxID=3079856 RepID=UPI002905FC39|nr:NAD(P)-dependent oxidoreductase [Rhodophyticola sp. MJ-SS7]MDU8944155.1 NAD(P)-dependent oxidoreductase [Rhodophyticola sp. MJ-SS7]